MPDTNSQALSIAAFDVSFSPAKAAVALLAEIANDPAIPLNIRHQATQVLLDWCDSLATPAQLKLAHDTLPLDDDLELDDTGVGVSMGDAPGFFIQTWSWVPCPDEDDS